MKRAIIAAAFVLLGFVSPGVANAETPPGCASAAQIGSTGYVKWRGDNIASVKQFAGCGSNSTAASRTTTSPRSPASAAS
ncbi:hypothetical protein SK854_03070 [Lentzea sp. BCCO 10_0061]|uniref:Uncharacterized protein n=1 Tax=Lentzea sokolovensis TaxID=3095429 RepID=A0ABU4UQJ3_9PSEU|nr:hypothetical protein [Lentzea sp. BCCO 10_0061]MDX8141076.1 hypothetical protein [Lentzea sp. BCCO 10_0061]